MKYVVTIEMDNAAFEAMPSRELRRILRTVVERLQRRTLYQSERDRAVWEGPLLDVNGNIVGEARVEN